LPKRNYGFEKRQKELNKQRKQKAKQQRRLDRTEPPPQSDIKNEEPPVGLRPEQ
jgi:hypothetical protein